MSEHFPTIQQKGWGRRRVLARVVAKVKILFFEG
jgi:hypothetical protein